MLFRHLLFIAQGVPYLKIPKDAQEQKGNYRNRFLFFNNIKVSIGVRVSKY